LRRRPGLLPKPLCSCLASAVLKPWSAAQISASRFVGVSGRCRSQSFQAWANFPPPTLLGVRIDWGSELMIPSSVNQGGKGICRAVSQWAHTLCAPITRALDHASPLVLGEHLSANWFGVSRMVCTSADLRVGRIPMAAPAAQTLRGSPRCPGPETPTCACLRPPRCQSTRKKDPLSASKRDPFRCDLCAAMDVSLFG
jgi:hypothetical protein